MSNEKSSLFPKGVEHIITIIRDNILYLKIQGCRKHDGETYVRLIITLKSKDNIVLTFETAREAAIAKKIALDNKISYVITRGLDEYDCMTVDCHVLEEAYKSLKLVY